MEKLKEVFAKMNTLGIPIPLLRDPNTKLASLSFTITVVATVLWTVGIISKWGNLLNINLEEAKEFFYASGFLYFGRSVLKVGMKTTEQKEKDAE